MATMRRASGSRQFDTFARSPVMPLCSSSSTSDISCSVFIPVPETKSETTFLKLISRLESILFVDKMIRLLPHVF